MRLSPTAQNLIEESEETPCFKNEPHRVILVIAPAYKDNTENNRMTIQLDERSSIDYGTPLAGSPIERSPSPLEPRPAARRPSFAPRLISSSLAGSKAGIRVAEKRPESVNAPLGLPDERHNEEVSRENCFYGGAFQHASVNVQLETGHTELSGDFLPKRS